MNKIKLAGAYDTVSSEPLEWQGNLHDTFKKFQVYGARPDPDHLPNFIKQYVIPLLDKYSKLDKNSNDRSDILTDVQSYTWFASAFVDYYLRQDKIPRVAYVLLETLAYASKVVDYLGGRKFYFGGESDYLGDSRYAQPIINLDYGFLKVLAQSGIHFSPSFLFYVMSGNDVSENGSRNKGARTDFITYINQSLPYTTLYFPENRDALVKTVNTPEYYNTPVLRKMLEESGVDASDSWKYISTCREIFVDAVSHSGVQSKEALPVVLAFLTNEDSQLSYDYEVFSPFPQATLVDVFQKMNDGIIPISKPKFAYFIDEYLRISRFADESDIEWLRSIPRFMEVVASMDSSLYSKQKAIEAGLGSVEETTAYLKDNPGQIDKMKYLGFMPNEVIGELRANLNEHNSKIKSSSDEAFKAAFKEGLIKASLANNDQEVSNFLLTEGVQHAGLTKEEVQNYAKYLTVYRFNGEAMKNFLLQSGSTVVGGSDFSANASGWFMPQFSDPVDNITKPAIFIRTDVGNTVEYLKGLADNLSISLKYFAKATTAHEGAHALHYLGAGDFIMESPVLQQEIERRNRKKDLATMTPEEREKIPGKRWESDEMLYLTDPSEIYARSHGDIPYLVQLFKERIEALKDSPVVAKAVENQWVDDVVGTIAGVASGGTNAALLQRDLTEGKGWLAQSDDPIQAINKILERQENKLRAAYNENIEEERRAETLSVMRKIKEVQNQLNLAKQSGDNELINQLNTSLFNLNKELNLVRKRRVFNVDGIGDLILAGYLRDYMMRLTHAVGSGAITTDRITPETADEIKMRQNDLKSKSTEDRIVPPTAADIRELSESLVNQSKPIPGGRMFDQIARLPLPPDARQGFYPHLQQKTDVDTTTACFKGWYRI